MRVVTLSVGVEKNDSESIRKILWNLSERTGDIGHLHWAYARAVRVTEKQQCDVSVGCRPEIKGIPGGIRQSESQFRYRRLTIPPW